MIFGRFPPAARLRLSPPAAPQPQPAAQHFWRADLTFLSGLSLLYLAVTVAVVLAVDRFWSANWDVEIFLGAARSFYDGGSLFDLYEKSRAVFYWPYPYPPLYALLLVPGVWIADRAAVLAAAPWASLLAVRLPPLLADLGIALLLYRIVLDRTAERWLARLGAAAWLFTPVLFYQTAIQAHQESVWLLPALAAYTLLDGARSPGSAGGAPATAVPLWQPALLLTLAICLKQSAVIYAVPFGLFLLWQRRWRDVAIFAGIFLLLFGGLALPFALHSGDFAYMVFEDVRNMPVQTQSWVVWLLSLEEYLVEPTRSAFPLVRHASFVTLAAAVLLSVVGLARRVNWYVLGLVITLAFFLLSQKAMAYHYPMIVPWLLAVWLPVRRLRLVTFVLVWVSWIVVSPYFAPWADAAHLPFYATLGTLNSLVFLALLVATLVRATPPPPGSTDAPREGRELLAWLTLLGLGFVLASLAQPFPALAPEVGSTRTALVTGTFAVVLVSTVLLWAPVARVAARALELPAGEPALRLNPRLVLAALWFVPLFFSWFTMTSEITEVIEKGLRAAWNL